MKNWPGKGGKGGKGVFIYDLVLSNDPQIDCKGMDNLVVVVGTYCLTDSVD